MKLVIYMDGAEGSGERLMQKVISQIPNTPPEFYCNIDLFYGRFFELGHDGTVELSGK